MKKMYLDREQTQPLDPALVRAWGQRRRSCVTVTPTDGPTPAVGMQVMADLGAGWVRVWVAGGLVEGQRLKSEVGKTQQWRRRKSSQELGNQESSA